MRAVLVAWLLAGLVAAPAPAGATVSVHFVEFDQGVTGPLGSVTFLGDSVGIGAGRFAPTLPDHLTAQGWGPVRFHAVDGGRTGLPPGWPEYFNAVPLIDQWQAQGWDSDTWIVNLGTNDSGYCGADVACARAAIMLVVDAIGPGHRIWWPKITRFPLLRFQADAWNAALDQIDAERDDVWAWDWPTEMQAHPDVYASYDNTHLYPDGYRRRSAAMADAFTRTVAVGTRVGGDVVLPGVTGAPAMMLSVAPERVLDTRTDPPGRLAAGGTITVDLTDDVPASATAVAVNLALVGTAAPGFLAAHPCDGPRPDTSNVNSTGPTRAAGAIVPLSSSGTICVFSSAAADVIVDLQAVLVPAGTPEAAGLAPIAPPSRLVDTRVTGRATTLTLPVPAGAAMVAVNVTATGADAQGFVTAYPCGGAVPLVSNVNVAPGETNAGAGFVRVGVADTVCVYSSASTDVVVDLTATLTTGMGLVYVPVSSRRMIDTRTGVGGWSPVHGAGQTFDVGVAPAGAGAVSGTLALVTPAAPSFVAAAPCGTSTTTSSINGLAGDVVANGLTVGVASGRVCLTALAAGHTVFDVTGWWIPA
jgi:hypothetical protein